MTEQDWATCTDPVRMVEALRGRVTDRKLRLFVCACCRRVWDRLWHPKSRSALEVAERYADGLASADEFAAAGRMSAEGQAEAYGSGMLSWLAAGEVANACSTRTPWEMARRAVAGYRPPETQALADLLRHVVPAPITSLVGPMILGPSVRALAAALYGGADVAFALHDALLDAGQGEWAEHFRVANHPKGCWVIDHILGKE